MMQLFALLLISGTMAQVAKILELGWSWCNLAPDRKRLFTAVVSLKTSNSPAAQTAMCLTFHSFVHLRCFLKVAILHYFPSRVVRCLLRCVYSFTYGNNQMLNSRHLRSDEFFCRSPSCTTSLPELWSTCYAAFIRSLTETFRGLNSCICALTSFSVGRHLAPLPFRSVIVLVGLGAFVCRVNERRLYSVGFLDSGC